MFDCVGCPKADEGEVDPNTLLPGEVLPKAEPPNVAAPPKPLEGLLLKLLNEPNPPALLPNPVD